MNLDADTGGGSWGFGSELNTGVLYFRATPGSLAVVQAWRAAMMRVRTAEFVNDQGIFNQVIHARRQFEPCNHSLTRQASHNDMH